MSVHSSPTGIARQTGSRLADVLRYGVRRTVIEPVQCIAFWLASTLPFPTAGGILTVGATPETIGLLAASVVCLVLGHGHHPGGNDTDVEHH